MMRMPTLSNNTDLPVLNGFAARSTWLMVIAAAVQVCTMCGIDLMAIAAAMGIGGTPEEVVASAERVISAWQMVAPLLLSIWAWVERRAPNFRLVWPWPSLSPTKTQMFGVLAFLGMAALAPVAGHAQGAAPCLPREQMLSAFNARFGEVPVAAGEVPGGVVEMLLAPDGSFTLIFTRDGESCLLASGVGWQFTLPPRGDPA